MEKVLDESPRPIPHHRLDPSHSWPVWSELLIQIQCPCHGLVSAPSHIIISCPSQPPKTRDGSSLFPGQNFTEATPLWKHPTPSESQFVLPLSQPKSHPCAHLTTHLWQFLIPCSSQAGQEPFHHPLLMRRANPVLFHLLLHPPSVFTTAGAFFPSGTQKPNQAQPSCEGAAHHQLHTPRSLFTNHKIHEKLILLFSVPERISFVPLLQCPAVPQL